MRSYKSILFLILTGILIIPSCEPDKKMLVETGDVSNISTTTADVSGTVIDVGEGATQHGHCYGTAAGPTVSGTKTALGVAVKGDFTSNLSGLQPSTTYYVRAYTSLGGETAYGSEISFATASAALAELTTTAITSITKTSAVSGGNITSEGGTSVTARGVCWNVASGPTVALTTKTTDGSGAGSFASSITGLSSNTVYYVRAYATNAGGTAYGNEISFTTSPEVAVAPTVTTVEVTSVTSNSAISGGDVTNEGGAPVTAKGVCWSTTANPTITSSKTTDGTGSGSYVSNLTDLNPGTTYYVRAYATNSAGTSYGNEYSFKTIVVVPTLTTVEVSAITNTTASSGGSITSDGGAPVTARGVCWSTSQDPTTADNKTNDGLGSGLFISNLTNLTGNTTYYIRAYATNSAGTAYGNELTFNTGAIVPKLTTAAVTSITSITAVSGGEISSNGGSSITAKGVCWSTSANPTTAGSKTSDGTGTDPFTSNITGLNPGTTYHIRAYATNSVGTAYGEDISFTTNTVTPTVTTSAITNIASTTATSGGNVASDGGAAVTARGVCWSTGQNPTLSDNYTENGTGTGSYVSNITGLIPNTTYYVRAYATNSIGTAYDPNNLTFVTIQAPTATTGTVSNLTTTSATLNGTVNANGQTTTVSFEYGTTTSYGSSVTASQSPVTGTSNTGVSADITGLTEGTIYHFRVKAVSNGGTAYGNDQAFSSLCISPSASTDACTGIGTNVATLNGTVNANGFSTTVWFEYGTTTSYGATVAATPSPVTGSSNTSVSAAISGLLPNTLYHYRVKTSNCGGAVDGDDQTFTTSCVAPTATTDAASGIGSTTATLNGTVNANDFSTTVIFEYGTSTSYGTTVYATPSPVTGSSNYSVNAALTGLTSNTLYHYRVKAVNCNPGPVYGSDMTFTTPAVVTTSAISNITATTALSGGTIEVGGAESISDRGICWNTSPNPIPDGSGHETHDGSGTGTFISSISGLTPCTTYHVRAWANNAGGIAYGSDIPFTTGTVLPTITTTPISPITSSSVSSGGNIAGDCAASVIVRGVCWSTSDYPTIADSHTEDGSGEGSFSSNITDLSPLTTYWVRAYATNIIGTVYGNQVSFTTDLFDADGNVYNVILIGTQLWMKENLKTTRYNNGDLIGTTLPTTDIMSETTPKYQWAYDGNESNVSTYGRLYTWYAATDNRTVCPSGWHVPTNDEWTTLTTYLGGTSDAGGKLKETGTTHWATPNTGATNESGFTALPGGARWGQGTSSGIGTLGYWWTATEYYDADHAWSRDLSYDSNSINVMNGLYKFQGFSVRCIRD